jgi:hypothetical protein
LEYLKKGDNLQEGLEDDPTNEPNVDPKFDEHRRLEKDIIKLLIEYLS